MPRHVEPPVGVGGPVGGGGAEPAGAGTEPALPRLQIRRGRKTTAAATAANHPGMRMTARARSATRIMRYWSHDQPVLTASVSGRADGLAWAAFSAAAAAVAAAHALELDPQVVAAAPPAPLTAELPPVAPGPVVPPDDPVDAATTAPPAAATGDPGVGGVETAAAPPVPFVHWVGPCLSQAGG